MDHPPILAPEPRRSRQWVIPPEDLEEETPEGDMSNSGAVTTEGRRKNRVKGVQEHKAGVTVETPSEEELSDDSSSDDDEEGGNANQWNDALARWRKSPDPVTRKKFRHS